MYKILTCLLIIFFNRSNYITVAPKKNILLICIDDLRPELASFGATYIHSPNIDKLAQNGHAFHNHYVNAPSCGPSRYTLLTGTYGRPGNDALFERSEKLKSGNNVNPSMPEWFKQHGYTTVSIGKVSHYPGGLGGVDWNNPNSIEMPNAWDKSLMPVAEWKHPRGAMHGLANGETRGQKGTMAVFQSEKGNDSIYPDGHITNEALLEIERLSNFETPFFLAVGLIKPHLPFGAPKQYIDLYENVSTPPIPSPEKPNYPSTWHKSSEFFQYNTWNKDPRNDRDFAENVRRHYAACVSYVDAQVGKIIKKLHDVGLQNNTLIVLWGDHGWSLGDHNIWGKHNLFEEALRSPLIIVDPSNTLKKHTNAIVETVDIFPTLCEMSNISVPSFINGVSLKPILTDANAKGHHAFSYNGKGKSIRTENYRCTQLKSGHYELYNHVIDPFETKNIALEYPEIVAQLSNIIKQKALIQKTND